MTFTRACTTCGLSILLAAFMTTSPSAQAKATMQQDPACQSLTPVSAGGPAPRDPDTLIVRWLGFTNYELAYRGNVFLLDAYFDQAPRRHPIGVTVKDIKKANALFIGHAHFDHISDAPAIAKQTGATIVGAQVGNAEFLKSGGVPAKQFKAVKSGDTVQFPGVTVEASLGMHSDPEGLKIPAAHMQKQTAALQVAALQDPFNDAEKQRDAAVRARGSRDPNVPTEGVIDFLFTFGTDFRVMFVDSNGGISDAQRQLAQRVPAVDVALLPYQYFEAGIPVLVDRVKTIKPTTVFLGNHDGVGTMGWASNYPPALAIREASPKTRTMDVIYRTPVCFNTTTKEMAIGW